MVAIGIIGLLAAVVLPSLSGARNNSRIKAETSAVEQFKLTLTLFREANRTLPAGDDTGATWDDVVDVLVAAGMVTDDVRTDEWGNTYAYEAGDGTYYTYVCSAGPDGTVDTSQSAFEIGVGSMMGNNDDICTYIR